MVPINNPRNQRALVIGLAGARLPLWLQNTFGEERMVVDVVELDKDAIKRAGGTLPAGAVRPLFAAAGIAGAAQDFLKGFETLFEDDTEKTDAATAAEDVVTGADGQKIRVYNVDGEDFVTSLAPLIPAEFRYNMVFLDACIAGGLEEVLQDPEGRFLKGLKQLLAPRATIGLNVEVEPSEYGDRGEPPRIAAMVRNMADGLLLGGGDIFTVRPTEATTYKNRIYCFLIEGRPQYLRGGPSINWSMTQSAQKVQTDFPPDAQGKSWRWSLDSEVNSCYQDWPPEKDGTIDQPWVLWSFATPFVGIAYYYLTGGDAGPVL
jgi:hypothetical protein